jgi:hypothetical protein
MPALDGLADHRRCDLIRDLDVPDFALPLRGEVGEQFWDHRQVADLVATQAEAACDGLERRSAEYSQAVVDAVATLRNLALRAAIVPVINRVSRKAI